ncbi:hypothetical protein [Mycobacterium sp. IDR2000157661]|nr:hypothetical protein [Mycobacterium sp. IDR2000157661]
MSTPQQPGNDDDAAEAQPASPAYSTPPPEGLPSADDDEPTTAE